MYLRYDLASAQGKKERFPYAVSILVNKLRVVLVAAYLTASRYSAAGGAGLLPLDDDAAAFTGAMLQVAHGHALFTFHLGVRAKICHSFIKARLFGFPGNSVVVNLAIKEMPVKSSKW